MADTGPLDTQLGAVKPLKPWQKDRARQTVLRAAVDAEEAWTLMAMLDLLPPGVRQPPVVPPERRKCESCDKPTVSSRDLQRPEGTVPYAGHGMCRPCLQRHRRKEQEATR